MAVEFRVLGDIEVRVDGEPVTIGYAQLRCVLAVLLVEANRTVPVEALVDRVWQDRKMPLRPRNAVQHNVTLLRKALRGGGVAIDWRSNGYRLGADPDTIDLHRFRALLDQARETADQGRATEAFEQALALWRGEPFAGLDTGWLAAVRATLIRQRHAARLDLTDLRLRAGRHADLLAELEDWVGRNPLDERLAGQYLLALYRCGRQAQALAHYERVRRRLAEQLGADPSPPLRELHRQILAADSAVAAPDTRPAPSVVPRQLPARPRLFTGRDREFARLTALLDEHGMTSGTLVISAIGGAGGIGKTWLALHWAHAQLHRFPDGQLHVNLRGFDPAAEPMAPGTALRAFIEALGVAPDAVPVDPDAQAALYRSLVAGRHMLILLDNARDADQVVPLLPGSPTCTVLVTSRKALTGLVVTRGAHLVELDVLTESEARDLLAGHLGDDRVAAEPDAVAELLGYCDGLPLAVSIVAAHAAAQPDFPLSVLAAELREHRLDALNSGEASSSLRTVLSWSYRALPALAAAVFGLLGLAAGPDISLTAAANLIGLSVVDTRKVLRELREAHLVRQHVPDRYRMHDLIRRYATEVAPADGDEPLRRLVDFHLHTAFAAGQSLDPRRRPIPLADPAEGVRPEPVPDTAAALAWLTAEHTNLLAAQRIAADRGWHAQVWQLAWALDIFHWWRGLLQQCRTMWQIGLVSAEALGDDIARMWCHRRLGNACTRLGLYEEALAQLRQALALAERTGQVSDEALTHYNLAGVWQERGEVRQALEHTIRARDLFHTLGAAVLEAHALNGAAWCLARLGDHEQARAYCAASLALYELHPDPRGRASTLDTLGFVALHSGRHTEALDHYEHALTLFAELGFAFEEANTLDHIGETHEALGRPELARSSWLRALELYRTQHRAGEADRVRRRLAAVGEPGTG